MEPTATAVIARGPNVGAWQIEAPCHYLDCGLAVMAGEPPTQGVSSARPRMTSLDDYHQGRAHSREGHDY